MAYATGSDLVKAFDANRIAELASDSGTPVPVGSLGSDGVVLQMLEDGAGEIRLACRVGNRYTMDDLDFIYNPTAFNSAHGLPAPTAHDLLKKYPLIRLNCDLAFGFLVARRGYKTSELGEMAPTWGRAQEMLQFLRAGERIFDAFGQAEAGSAVPVIRPGISMCRLVIAARRSFGPISVFNDAQTCGPGGVVPGEPGSGGCGCG